MRISAERKNEGVHHVNGNVLKFGGTSLGDASALIKSAAIVEADENVRAVVVSAPGKRHNSDKKITDLLYDAARSRGSSTALAEVKNRFDEMILSLGARLDFAAEYEKITRAAIDGDARFFVSRGEYLMAKIMAKYLDFSFVDAADVIRFDSLGALDKTATFELVRAAATCERCVIPGFYGADDSGTINIFPRGGSDITGAVVSAALGCDYYNYTDVSGFMYVDPKFAQNPRAIPTLSFDEAVFLASYGATVLHADAARYAGSAGVETYVKNTFMPSDAGTHITAASSSGGEIYGVSGVYAYFGDRSAIAVGGSYTEDAISYAAARFSDIGVAAELHHTERCGVVFNIKNDDFERAMRALDK